MKGKIILLVDIPRFLFLNKLPTGIGCIPYKREITCSAGFPMHKTENNIDIRGMLERGDIVSFFQPIVSVKKKLVIGFEALSRGISSVGADPLPPRLLFDTAEREGLTTDLDRLCRAKAFESFGAFNYNPERYLLTVNIDPSILDEGTVGSNHLRELVRSL
ncbi:MAG: EAL domain-containing protein, partial [Spirochaetales bacterium]